MPKYTVHLLTPYMSWEGVEAKSKKEAIAQCNADPEPDADYQHMVAIREELDDVDERNCSHRYKAGKCQHCGQPEEL